MVQKKKKREAGSNSIIGYFYNASEPEMSKNIIYF